MQARERGVNCRLLVEHGTLDEAHEQFLANIKQPASKCARSTKCR